MFCILLRLAIWNVNASIINYYFNFFRINETVRTNRTIGPGVSHFLGQVHWNLTHMHEWWKGVSQISTQRISFFCGASKCDLPCINSGRIKKDLKAWKMHKKKSFLNKRRLLKPSCPLVDSQIQICAYQQLENTFLLLDPQKKKKIISATSSVKSRTNEKKRISDPNKPS